MSDKLLRRRALLAKLGFSSSTLHRKIKAGEFPPPLILGNNMRGWKESTADEYIRNLPTDYNPIPVAPGSLKGRKSKKDRGDM